MNGQITIHGDIFSTGAWPSDEEIVESYNEQAAEKEPVEFIAELAVSREGGNNATPEE